MNRWQDYGRRDRPDERYGGGEQGYGRVPGDSRPLRRRDLSGGRYGSSRPSGAYEAGREDWRYADVDERTWHAGRGRPPRQDWAAQGRPRNYPGRYAGDEYPPRGAANPRQPGYVDAYSTGYMDGYRAGERAARQGVPAPGEVPSSSRFGHAREERPRHYRPADEELRESVCERLADEDELDTSEVIVTALSGVVTLDGHVNSRREKYLAEDIAADTYGVDDVVNRIHVRPFGVLASS